MRQRRNVDNLGYFDTGSVYSTDSRFTTVSGAFYISLYFSQAKVKGNFCTILCGHLGGIGSIFLRSSEAHLSGRRPRDDLSFGIGKGYDDVVERRVYVKLAHGFNFYVSLLCCDCLFCHT